MSHIDYSDLYTLRDWVRYGSSRFAQENVFFGHGTDNEWDEAMVLALHVTHQPWSRIDQIIDTRLTLQEKNNLAELFEKRIEKRVPAVYLTGEAWFAGLLFKVNANVLVPRSPIAELIQNGFEPWIKEYPQHILDLCTGSGCIGIATAYAFEEAQVDLSDISEEALKVAQENIKAHNMEDRVCAIESDCFDGLAGKKYDLIVSNPPYVNDEDLNAMPAEFHAEPALGLGSGKDGLDITKRILKQAANHLNPNGVLIVEVGNSWVALEEAFPQIAYMWLEFEHGGHGVFVLTKEQLENI